MTLLSYAASTVDKTGQKISDIAFVVLGVCFYLIGFGVGLGFIPSVPPCAMTMYLTAALCLVGSSIHLLLLLSSPDTQD